ncbi:CoA pyrophosphatase [Flavobacterium sp. GT3R68]|uniref:NUDIX hydrolase n=1 Tax=Flavobacterium sp. GT3R68 TaxID=2594437 RepID=UPI000F89371D|nr:CoA pyrophosphatase [Flavobacterium sp. GT3R68]RTY95381.1 CoA pyrophosphatase [Flavobacterium sp. GSN2]TRW90879.1 CoA pyrophosphatase [Flavobacterium sp. GT3R68]
MDFADFLKYVPKIEKEKLLAADAHMKMAPLERVSSLSEEHYYDKNPRKAAVMMLFYPKNKQTHLVLIVRNTYPGIHSSQIAFPGGKVELEDASLAHTALRETHEEIGVHPEKITVIKAFSEIYIPPSNFLVAPFLGISHSELTFTEQEDEVAGIIELPIFEFMNEDNIVMKRMNTSYADDIEVPAFKIKEHYVWGATAMMMSELKEVLKRVF